MTEKLDLKRVRKSPVRDVYVGPSLNLQEQPEQLREQGLRLGTPYDYLQCVFEEHELPNIAFDIACVLIPQDLTRKRNYLLVVKDGDSEKKNLASELMKLNRLPEVKKRRIPSSSIYSADISEGLLLEGVSFMEYSKRSSNQFRNFGEMVTDRRTMELFPCTDQGFSCQVDSSLIQRFRQAQIKFEKYYFDSRKLIGEFEPLKFFSFLFSESDYSHYPSYGADWYLNPFRSLELLRSEGETPALSFDVEDLKPLEVRQLVALRCGGSSFNFSVRDPNQKYARLYVPEEKAKVVNNDLCSFHSTFVNLREIQDSLVRLNFSGLEKQLFEDLVKNGEIK